MNSRFPKFSFQLWSFVYLFLTFQNGFETKSFPMVTTRRSCLLTDEQVCFPFEKSFLIFIICVLQGLHVQIFMIAHRKARSDHSFSSLIFPPTSLSNCLHHVHESQEYRHFDQRPYSRSQRLITIGTIGRNRHRNG